MMKDIKPPSLNGDKIAEIYPKAFKELGDWMVKLPNAETLGKDALIYDQGIKAVLYFSPRALYEFFDSIGIEMVISKVDDTHWSYHIIGTPHSFSADGRIAAEEQGFSTAFETLENQLSK